MSLFLISSLRDEMLRGPSEGLRRQKHSCVRGQALGRAEHGWSRAVDDRPWLSIADQLDGAWLARTHLPWLGEILLYSCNTTLILFFVVFFFPQKLTVSITHNGLNKDNLVNVLSWVIFPAGAQHPFSFNKTSQPSIGYQVKQAKVFA